MAWVVEGAARERSFRRLGEAISFKTGIANMGLPVILEDSSRETVDSAAPV